MSVPRSWFPVSARYFDDDDERSQAHRKEHAEAALMEAKQVLDDRGLQYVIYVKTGPTTFARAMRFGTGKGMVHGYWFVISDLVDGLRDIAKFTGEAVDDSGGIDV